MGRKELLNQAVCEPCIHSEPRENGLLKCLNPRFGPQMRLREFSPTTNLYDVLRTGDQTQEIRRIDRTSITCAEVEPDDPSKGTIIGGTPRRIWR